MDPLSQESPPRASEGDEPLETTGASLRGQLALHAVGFFLACGLLVLLLLRVGLGERGPAAPASRPPPEAEAARSASAAAIRPLPSPSPLLTPFAETLPNREPLAGLVGARERFGHAFPIRHPAYLPADVAPFTVNWQPDADPGRRDQGYGELLSWFYSAEHGAVLVLAQGPGVGVWPLTAPEGRAGRLRLADGSEVIWQVGHPVRVTAAGPGPDWEGTEITLGVAPSDGPGWYLRSPIIRLDELLRVAESLR